MIISFNPTGIWLAVDKKAPSFFFVSQFLPTLASKNEWRRRGWAVKPEAKMAGYAKAWVVQNHWEADLYDFADCRPIAGQQASNRRGQFSRAAQVFVWMAMHLHGCTGDDLERALVEIDRETKRVYRKNWRKWRSK